MRDLSAPLLGARNQDALRVAPTEMSSDIVAKALLWINGYGSLPMPVSVYLNLTNRCMGRCVHCGQWAWPHRPEFTKHQLRKLFETFHRWQLKAITFGGGNPILHKHFAFALELANHYGIKVGIITEGARMSDEVIAAICEMASWIRFSLDGPDSTVHDGIRNADGLFELVMSCIERLNKNRGQLRIGLNCVLQKRNLRTIPQMMLLDEQIGVDYLLFKIPHGDDVLRDYLPSLGEWKDFWQWAKQHSKNRVKLQTNLAELISFLDLGISPEDMVAGKPVRKLYLEKQIQCFVPLFHLTVDSVGDVYPCCYLLADNRVWDNHYNGIRKEFLLGNVFKDEDRIFQILSTKFHKVLRFLPSTGYPECGNCTRFFQMNTFLTDIYGRLPGAGIDQNEARELITEALISTNNSYFL